MKRIVNILSCLCLLLLLLVAACSDLEEIVVNMQGEEEVELTIRTNIPSLGGSTRTAPTENINSITALAFDSDHELIKVAIEDVTISPDPTPSTKGTYTVKVPVRTRRIHFIAKNNGVFDTFSTETDYGKKQDELLQDLTTKELHYWGKLDFANADELKSGGDVTLIRNMAKLVLETSSDEDYIAGLLNHNVKGTIVPYKDGVLGYQTATNHDLPTNFEIANDGEGNLGKVHYMFEEFNDIIGETTDLVYAICNVDDKFYKIAFKSGDSYYYIIRNQVYTIKIAGALDDKLGKDTYADAVQNGSPINDTTKEQVHITFKPDGVTTFPITDTEVSMFLGKTGKVRVIIPEGITELQIGYKTEFFDEGGLTANVIDGGVIAATSTETKDDIYIKTYDVTDIREFELSIDLKESVTEAIDGMEIQFIGSGEKKQSNDKLTVNVLKRDDITLSRTAVEIPKSAGSEFTVSVTMPSFDNFDGNFNLQVTDVDDKFTISPESQDGIYSVAEGSTTTFTFTLKEDGDVGDVYTINFVATSDFHRLTGITTVTLIDDAVPDQDKYEIWVGDRSAWTGMANSVEFFGYNKATPDGSFAAGNTPAGFRTDFYDQDANNHKSKAMQMGSDDSFTFTIPEGSNRWLTMLVAANSGTPSINLLKDGEAWTTTAEANATTVKGTYNFGNGEIGTAGRLIRYELEPGTYTLKGSDAAYLLYYMRVSKARPEMTDVAQPLLTDYNLSWSGGAYANTEGKGYLKISDAKHIVDEDNLTHTVSLKAENSLSLNTSLNLTSALSTFDLYITQPTYTFVEPNDDNNNNGSITIGNDNLDEYKNKEPNSELRLEKNGGDYVLSGKIIEPDYKYSAFYDVLQLNQVEYEVKNPIVPALYNSMDGDKLTPVENWTTMDDAWAIGFFMPSPMPIEYASASDRPAIAISIPDWTKSDSGTSSGLGVVVDSENKIYTLTTQDNSVHPRPGWTYKIQWADRASSTISPEIVDESSDVYFTYMGNIAKKVDVAVPEIKETSLNITLDFYAENGVAFDDLKFGETKFYLKATIPSGIPAGKRILLNLATEGRGGISEHHSRDAESSKGISYHYTEDVVDGLVITTAEYQTEYLMCWKYVRSDENNTNDVTITYTVSSDKHTLTNETQASITIKGNSQAVESQILVATNGSAASNNLNLSLEYGANSTEEFTVDVPVPDNVSGIKISAPDYLAASIGKVKADNEQYPGAAVAVNGNYTFTDSDKTTDPRFKFKLNGTPTENPSVITFTSADGNASKATVTVNWTQRGAEINQTTIWSGAMDLQWTQNYLEATTNQLAAGTQVTLNFTTTGGQIKLHDAGGKQIASGDIHIQGITYDANNGVSVGNGVTQLTFTLQNAVNGLKINGNNVRMTSIVVSTATASTEVVIDITNGIGMVTNNGGNGSTVTVENGSLVLKNPSVTDNDYDVQLYVNQNYNAGSYTLTYKVKGDKNGYTQQAFQVIDGYVNASDFKNYDFTTDWSDVDLTFNVTRDCDRFLINFGKFDGTIYIDNLKLVKNN